MSTRGSSKSRRSFSDFLVHIHPQTIPADTLRFTLSCGLGGMAAMLIFLLFTTGMLQLLMYEPTVTGAYTSVQAMYSSAALGGWIRNIHHWSANLLVIVAVLHLLRVFLTGAIGPGRRLNWIIGIILLFLVLSANFSGYLLPWDQLAYWAVTICTSMMEYIPIIGPWMMELFRGGSAVGQETLANFYGLHIAIVPFSILFFTVWHFWLVRKSGGLIRTTEDKVEAVSRVPAVPDLIVREAAIGLGLVAFVMLLSSFYDAPLLEQANPGMSPNPAKAPWYFVGFQELLLHLHPVFAICVIPTLFVLLICLLPFCKGAVLDPGVWFGGTRGCRLAIRSFSLGIILTFAAILLDEILFRTAKGAGMADMLTRGYLPLTALSGLLAGEYLLLIRRWKFSRAEAVMAGMLFCFAVLVSLTIIGIWFRGPGMQLMWQ